MAARKSPPFHVSPSIIARYFFHDCERFLYYSSVSPEQQRKKLGLPRSLAFDHSLAGRAPFCRAAINGRRRFSKVRSGVVW